MPIKLYIAGGLVVSLLISSVWAYRAEKRADEMKEARDEAVTAARANSASLSLCLIENDNNAIEGAIQRGKVELAEAQLEAQEAATQTALENIGREAEEFHIDDFECPALTADFRRWVQGD